MRPHKKLEVWIKAVEFVTKIYRLRDSFPDSEKFGPDIPNKAVGSFNSK